VQGTLLTNSVFLNNSGLGGVSGGAGLGGAIYTDVSRDVVIKD